MVEKVQKKVASEEKMFQVDFLPLIRVNLLPVDVASWLRVHFEIDPFLWNEILDLGLGESRFFGLGKIW